MRKIPLYERSAPVSTQVPTAQASVGAATAVADATAQLGGTISQIAGMGSKMVAQHNENRAKLEAERLKSEGKLLELDAKNRIGLLVNDYKGGLSVGDSYDTWGTESDEGLKRLNEGVNEILSNPKFEKHGNTLAELQIHAQGEIGIAGTDAYYSGIKEMHNQGKATFKISTDIAIGNGDAAAAQNLIKSNPFITDAERIQAEAELPALIDHQQMTKDYYSNPSETIKNIDAQQAGRGDTYPNLSKEDLRSGRAYAKKLLAERQQEAMDGLYTPNSGYEELSPTDKQATIDIQHDNGLISSAAWKGETERIKNPRMSDIRPQDNRDYLSFQRRLFGASGNPEEQTKILNEVTASGMPSPMRTQLYNLQKDIASPTGKTKQASYKYARETMSAVFGREDVLPGVAPFWNIFADQPAGFTEESREDLNYRAHAEAQSELLEWMQSEPSFNEAQINAKVYDIVGQKSKQYGISQIPERLGEQVVAPTEPKSEATQEIDVQTVFDEVLAEMPDASEDEQRAEINKRLGR